MQCGLVLWNLLRYEADETLAMGLEQEQIAALILLLAEWWARPPFLLLVMLSLMVQVLERG